MTDKLIKSVIAQIMKGNAWQKFANPIAPRGKTAYPTKSADQKRFGIRFDYDKVVTKDDTEYHLFKMQPNAGKIPSAVQAWRNKNSTHAVMAEVWVKKGAAMEEVKVALEAARKAFKNA